MAKKHSKAHIQRMTTLMFAAIKAGDVEGVRNALSNGADPGATRYGYTGADLSLLLAHRWGLEPSEVKFELVKEMLEAGSRVTEQLIKEAHLEITPEWFDLFKRHGIEIDEKVIAKLVRQGEIELWDHCKDRIKFNTKRINGAPTSLHRTLREESPWGSTRGYAHLDPARVGRLLEAGCGIEDRWNGDTPLIVAVKMRDQGAAEALLFHGADVAAKDANDMTLAEILESETFSEDMKSLVNGYLLRNSTITSVSSPQRRRL